MIVINLDSKINQVINKNSITHKEIILVSKIFIEYERYSNVQNIINLISKMELLENEQ